MSCANEHDPRLDRCRLGARLDPALAQRLARDLSQTGPEQASSSSCARRRSASSRSTRSRTPFEGAVPVPWTRGFV